MSLNKGIKHGKEKRQAYRGVKAVDATCRPGGSCPHCEKEVSDDIVDRLREASHYALMDAARKTVVEAADEIERLRLQVQALSNHIHWLSDK